MNDEIREILDKLSNRKQETLIMELRQCQLKNIEHPFITKEEYIDKILDYITNLQQIEQEHKKINGELREENSKLEIALQNIQEDYDRRLEENERLKEIINDDMTVYLEGLEDGKEKMKQCFESIYKSRCEKAIEYINENVSVYAFNSKELPHWEFDDDNINNLLDILQNGSDTSE